MSVVKFKSGGVPPLHTNEMQEIISKPPSWLLRWGISLFFGVLLLIVILAEFIQYPDVVKTQLKIATISSTIVSEMDVPQENYTKVKVRQAVLIKLKSYPSDQFGIIRGIITKIADFPSVNGQFLARVEINKAGLSDFKSPEKLSKGLEAEAEIITEDVSLRKRLLRSVFKGIIN